MPIVINKVNTVDIIDPVKVYVATSYELHASAQLYVDWLQTQDSRLINVSRWIWDEEETDHVAQKALMDFADVDKADALIAFWPFGKGTSAEIAYAFACRKQIIMYIPRDFYDEGRIACMPVGVGSPLHTEGVRGHDCILTGNLIGTPVIVHQLEELKQVLTYLRPLS